MATIAYRKTKPMLHLFINLKELTIQKRFTPEPKIKVVKPKFEFKKELMDIRVVEFAEAILSDTTITLDEIISPSRVPELIKMRHLIVYLLHKHCDLTFQKIGKSLNRDHSSMVHANQSVCAQLSYDKK